MVGKAEQAAAIHYLQFEIQWSSLALLFFDYALTFPMEVKYIWGSKFRLSTVLYIWCRYALVANVLYLLAIGNRLGNKLVVSLSLRCDAWYKFVGALSVLGRAAVIVAFSARTYAIYNRNRWILIYFSLLGLACIILDVLHVPDLACIAKPEPIRLGNAASGILAALMVIFEYSSAILTIIRSVQAFRAGGPWSNHKGGFLYLIFEQGVFYFSVVSLTTTCTLVLNFIPAASLQRTQTGVYAQRVLNAFTLPLSCLLTARFLLYLRHWEFKHSHNINTNNNNTHHVDHHQTHTTSFRAAPAPGVLSTIIDLDDFGLDPRVTLMGNSNLEDSNTDLNSDSNSGTNTDMDYQMSPISSIKKESRA
ncbi:hypothetical protein E1B28_002111 [Marasmius oreades]|uniref:DUF6533 domain-containing protein n=1 Tax=Marasmius oreades TaxID=181124 RepID=A0A9P7RN08_9AGAR|nr:uncharacterized protein E1B28_002111 [Marasmius oreades]KAG7086151.1 hypothetical protein E1B28_002111 [Marasmius oreades]